MQERLKFALFYLLSLVVCGPVLGIGLAGLGDCHAVGDGRGSVWRHGYRLLALNEILNGVNVLALAPALFVVAAIALWEQPVHFHLVLGGDGVGDGGDNVK